jgi:hypothetical protein
MEIMELILTMVLLSREDYSLDIVDALGEGIIVFVSNHGYESPYEY